MPSKVTYNDFRGGMLSEKLRRRIDLENFYNSASMIKNAVSMRTGGLKLRPGLSIFEPTHEISRNARIFTYTVSVDESYSVIVAPSRIYIYGDDGNGGIKNVAGDGFPVSYSESDLLELVSTQNYECMVLCQRNNPPYVIKKKQGVDGFSCSRIVLDIITDRTNDDGTSFYWQYDGLFTEKDFPSACAFMSERLWFMGSNEHPYRIWASRPFDYFNFQTQDYYKVVDEALSAEQYAKALSEYGSKSEDIESDDTIYFKDNKVVSADGYVTITQGIADKSTDLYLSINDSRLTTELVEKYKLKDDDGNIQNPKSEAFMYTQPVEKWELQDREDCSIELEPSSNKNETISWIEASGDLLYIGTMSSEFTIPYDITASSGRLSRIGAYGSSLYRQSANGCNSIFYIQSGARRIRAISISSDGVVFSEPTFQADSIFEGDGNTINEISWQRVPEPRLYAVLGNGKLAVLSYDPYYSMNAWCIWESEYKIKSLSIRDTLDGQDVVCLIEDKNGHVSIGIFKEDRLYDGNIPIKAEIITNNIDSTSTLSSRKSIYNVYLDTMQTEFTASQDGLAVQASRNYESNMVRLALNTRTCIDGIKIKIESMEGKPFTLLALIVEVEVS